MKDLKPIIAKNITDLRTEAGMTQIGLAEKLNYSDKAISKWERGESIPDITVLYEIADMFGVTLDYLTEEEHSSKTESLPTETAKKRNRNRVLITLLSILCVWFCATLSFSIVGIVVPNVVKHWLAFIYAVPISMIVWLVFNSVWFNRRRNFLIVSLLMWSLLTSLFLSFVVFGYNIWLIYLVGIPGQIIIMLWSRLK